MQRRNLRYATLSRLFRSRLVLTLLMQVVSARDTVKATQRSVLVESVKMYPWNWSAWADLSAVLKDVDMLQQIDAALPSHFLKPFWRAHAYLELQQNQNAHQIYVELLDFFPASSFLKGQIALAKYNLQGISDRISIPFESPPYSALCRF